MLLQFFKSKITEKNYPKEIAQAAIDKLKAEGYYKEEFYTNSAIRKHIRKGRTPDLVKRYLNEEGIQLSVAEITEKSGEINNNEYSAVDQIDELILKKQSILSKWAALEKEDKYKAEQKLLRYLVAKGHQLGACRTAIKKYIETNLTGEDSY